MDTADFPAAPDTPSDTPTPASASSTPPPADAAPPAQPFWRDPYLLLVLAAAVQFLAFFLPWEHLREFDSAVPGNYATVDLPVYSLFLRNPGQTYAVLLLEPSLTHSSLAALFWDVFWRAALPTLGLLLALALLLWTRRVARLPLAFLSVLWLVVTSAMLVNFALTIISIRAGNTHFAPRSVPDWWQLLTGTSVTISGQQPSFAYGYWVFALATLAFWLALAQIVRALVRPAVPAHMPAAHSADERSRLRPLVPALLTLGIVIWLVGLLALPIISADCAHPLTTISAAGIQGCERSKAISALQIPPVWTFVQPRPPGPLNPNSEQLGVLLYFRDFALLVLAMTAVPLALAAAWTAGATRTRAVVLSAWAALVLFETILLLQALSGLLSLLSQPSGRVRTDFPLSTGPAVFLVPLGALLALVAVALYWRAALRRP